MLPYSQTFDDVSIKRWFANDGDWAIRDGALVQETESVEAAHLFVPHWLPESQPYHLTLQIAMADTTRATGIDFNAQYPRVYTQHHRVFVSRNGEQLELVAGYVGEIGGFQTQLAVPISPTLQTYTLDLLVDESIYNVQLDGKTLIYKRPLFYQGGLIGMYSADGPSTFDNMNLEAAEAGTADASPAAAEEATQDESDVAPESTPASIELPAASNVKAGSGVGGQIPFSDKWVPFSGDWQVVDGALSQLDADGIDFSIGYQGGVFESYALRVSLSHLKGVGGGLLFNMPSPSQLNGAHMVRYSDTADAIFWGYYDEDGAFTGQGYAKLSPAGQAKHSFEITSAETTYDIYLDDQLIARDIPLIHNSGYLGLITSRSAVTYDLVNVVTTRDSASQSGPIAGPGTLPGNLRPVSGDWTIEDTAIRQNLSEPSDFIISTGMFAGEYTLETRVTLPQNPDLQDAGGGIIFHMPGRSSKANAHMVRLTNSGRGVFWGYYDDREVFVGQGWAELPGTASLTYDLKVIVQNDTYDLLINGEAIATDGQLMNQEGWIGLLAYRGPVTFQDVRVTLGSGK